MGLAVLCCLACLTTTPLAVGGDWPQFRGPTGDGHAHATDLPLAWSETENVRWKVPIHGRGWSSPVIGDDRIWMTTADEDGRRLFAVCVDRPSGRILRDVLVFNVPQPEEIHAFNSYASPTPVLEGDRLWVHFGSYGTACLDAASGRMIWSRRDIKCDHFRGPGSSPVLFGDLLILHFDGIDVQFLTALDKRTGKTVWTTPRSTDFGDLVGDLRKAYVTPTIVPVEGGFQLVSSGAQAAMAYDPATGRELWKVRYKGFSNVSRPLFGHGLVYVNTGFSKAQLWAVRPTGRGDVTDTHVVWRATRSIPLKPSPVLVGDLLVMVDDKGVASCLDAVSGRTLWRQRLGGAFSSSPVYADGRIYCFDEDGTTSVIAPLREYKRLARNELEAGCMASPAALGHALYVRTKTHLYRLEKD